MKTELCTCGTELIYDGASGQHDYFYCSHCGANFRSLTRDYADNAPLMPLVRKPDPCIHESELTADGNGAFCKHCGKTLC